MKEINSNRKAWDMLAEDHYHVFKKALTEKKHLLNRLITEDLGDIKGKTVLHLQCNTGADTLSLARLGAKSVTGVDFSSQNIAFAKKLAEDLQIDNATFIESNVLTLDELLQGTFDLVFTSEGVLGWLNDIAAWGKIVKHFLKPNGFFYVCDSHPFYMTFDEVALEENKTLIKYPYFNKDVEVGDTIGGYAAKERKAETYFWMHTFSDIINALVSSGLAIDWLIESDLLAWNGGGMQIVEDGLFQHPTLKTKIPMTFRIKASHR